VTLGPEDLDADPIRQVGRWLAEAERAGSPQPLAMALATASASSEPSVRFVLLRGIDRRGLAFYTNYESPKAHDLQENPRAAVALYWPEQGRQIRAAGRVERMSREESDAYWDSRPTGHRLAAAASPQSRVIAGREELEAKVAEIQARHPDGDVPRPAGWGGYRLVPDTVEVWESGEDRLHDRFRYRRDHDGWALERLAP